MPMIPGIPAINRLHKLALYKIDAKFRRHFPFRSHLARKTGESYSVEINIMADERVFCA